jgi:hypothetical protein
VDYDLRRVRRDLQPAVGHSVRNTVILVLILLAAASLTVWLTQGIKLQGAPEHTTTTETNARLPESGAIASEQPIVPAEELASWPSPWQQNGSAAPALQSWPPAPSKSAPGPSATIGVHREESKLLHGWPQASDPLAVSPGGAVRGGHEMAPENAVRPDSVIGTPPVVSSASAVNPSQPAPAAMSDAARYDGPIASLGPIEPVGPVRR